MTSMKLLWRELRTGELHVLIAALLLATAAITSVSLFTSRIENSIYDRASELIAADAQVVGSMAMPERWLETAANLALQQAHTIRFQAMVLANDKMQLVAAKAVSPNYPLKGTLHVADTAFAAGERIQSGPDRGEIWLASRLFSALGIKPGDLITLGNTRLKVSKVLVREPDNAESLFGVAPRAMMHIDDVPQTGVVQLGSRVNYTWMLAGEQDNVAQLKASIDDELNKHHRWVSVKQGNRGVNSALDRAERFLLLAGSLTVILCSIAIALAARRFAAKQRKQVALLKTFGRTPNQITQLYCIELVLLGVLSVLIGSALGWLFHWVILQLFAGLLPATLAPANAKAYMTGAISGLVALASFAGPPLLELRRVSPAQVLRETQPNNRRVGIALLVGFTALVLLVWWFSASWMITALLFGAGLGCALAVAAMAWALVRISRIVSQRWQGAWRMGMANLYRHRGFNTLQILIFSLALMLLLILISVRTGLITQWQNQLPEDAPNHFAFNIFPEEKSALARLFKQENIARSPFYPMVRGRLIDINGEALKTRIKEDAQMNYERELNLTWSSTLGEDNEVVQGHWWTEQDATTRQLSIEREYAEGLGIVLGDVLRFSIAGEEFTATVSSIREVKWDSMNPNFFVIFNQQILDGSAANWLTSFYLPFEQKTFLTGLTQKHPTISVIEIDQMIEQIKDIVSQVSLAIEFILVLILVAGALVLIASIQATLDSRLQESAIMRTLGAKRALVKKILLIEFATLGALSGLIAALGTQLALYFIQTRLFNLDYQPYWLILVTAPLASALLIGLVGWASTRQVVSTPPLSILRRL